MLQRLRMLTAGESHGPALVGILEGIPAGLAIGEQLIGVQLQRRRQVAGRGGRSHIETDAVQILAGVRHGHTLGSPLALLLTNRDFPQWSEIMSVTAPTLPVEPVTVPRPGHIDLAGCLKYDTSDTRNVSERASARETAMRTALGAICRQLLLELGISVGSQVLQAGSICDTNDYGHLTPGQLNLLADKSPLRCLDPGVSAAMQKAIDEATATGDTLGGKLAVRVAGVPAGLGSTTQWDTRLQARLGAALLSIGGMKGFEIGSGFSGTSRPGSEANDAILPVAGGFRRPSNNAGGLEGGLSNGEEIILRVAMKPVPTLRRPQQSVDLVTGKSALPPQERGDSWAVAAASIVAEAMTCLVLVDALLEKFGGDTLNQLQQHLQASANWSRPKLSHESGDE